jgi:hypothetical protein
MKFQKNFPKISPEDFAKARASIRIIDNEQYVKGLFPRSNKYNSNKINHFGTKKMKNYKYWIPIVGLNLAINKCNVELYTKIKFLLYHTFFIYAIFAVLIFILINIF